MGDGHGEESVRRRTRPAAADRLITYDDDPVDLDAFRVARQERERERIRKEFRRSFPPEAVDYGRVVPPPLNANVPEMVQQITSCYTELSEAILGYQHDVTASVAEQKLAPSEYQRLFEHYRDLKAAIDTAAAALPAGCPGSRADDFTDRGAWNAGVVHLVADHAKHVYAVGTRDIAALQYRLAELSDTGRLNFEAHEHFQRAHCWRTWETLYAGTLSPLHDQHTWDGAWDWYDNTYSDGRQVMVQARVTNWMKLNQDWPYNRGICGDGPVLEHPRGSLCQIFPVVDPNTDGYTHPWIDIDLEELIEQLGPPSADGVSEPGPAVGGQ